MLRLFSEVALKYQFDVMNLTFKIYHVTRFADSVLKENELTQPDESCIADQTILQNKWEMLTFCNM